MTHLSNAFPVLGISRVDVSYPFKMPTVFFDDFVVAAESDFASGNHKAKWKVAGTNADPTNNITRPATPAGNNGVVNCSTSASSGDEFYAQVGTNSGFMLFENSTTDPRPIVFQSRMCQTTTVANSTFATGLCIGTGITGATDPVGTQCEGAYFVCIAGTVYWCYKTSATTVAITAAVFEDTNTAVPTLVVSTFHTFTVLYDGAGTVQFLFDGRRVKTGSLPTFTARTINPFFGVTANTAAAAAVNVDYIYVAQDNTSGGRT